MNNTLIKDFILDCLDLAEKMVVNSALVTDCILLESCDEFTEKIREAKNFINSLENGENTKDEKIDLYVKDIMKKFDTVIEQIKEK